MNNIAFLDHDPTLLILDNTTFLDSLERSQNLPFLLVAEPQSITVHVI